MKKRPVAVWIIFIWDIFTFVFYLFGLYAIFTGALGVPPSTLSNLPFGDTLGILTSLLIGGLNLAGSVTLFLLRRISVVLFSTAFVLNVGITLLQIIRGFPLQSLPFISLLVGWTISALIIWYSHHLAKRGILS